MQSQQPLLPHCCAEETTGGLLIRFILAKIGTAIVLAVNVGFILREKPTFSVSYVLVVLSTCAAELIYFASSATKGSLTSASDFHISFD